MLGPGDSEIGLNPNRVVLVDEASIFTFPGGVLEMGHIPSCILHRCGPMALVLWPGPTNPPRWCPALGRAAQGPLDSSYRFHKWCSWQLRAQPYEGVLAYTYWNRRIRIRAHSEVFGSPFGQSGRAHVLTSGSFRLSNPPSDLAYGSGAAVVGRRRHPSGLGKA